MSAAFLRQKAFQVSGVNWRGRVPKPGFLSTGGTPHNACVRALKVRPGLSCSTGAQLGGGMILQIPCDRNRHFSERRSQQHKTALACNNAARALPGRGRLT